MSNPYLTQPDGHNHKVDTDTHVFFYEQDFYVLSNFSSFEVRWPHHEPEAPWFKTAEHLYHYLKFAGIRKDAAVHAAISVCKAHSAHDAYLIAQSNKQHRRSDWDEIKFTVMRDILRAKVALHPYVKKKLLQTGDRILVEDSWRDDVWGWGYNKDGQNMLGKLWMEVREEVRQQEKQSGQPKV